MKLPFLTYEQPFRVRTWLPISECLDRIETNIRINSIDAKWKTVYQVYSVYVDRERNEFEITVSYRDMGFAKAKAVGSITTSNSQTIIEGITRNAGWQYFYILPPLVFAMITIPCALIMAFTEWKAIIWVVMFPVMLAILYITTSEQFSTVMQDALNDAFYDAKITLTSYK